MSTLWGKNELSKLTTAQQEARRADFTAALGGDSVAQRTSNALTREGMSSVAEVRLVAEQLGAKEFYLRIMDIRNLGEKSIQRIFDVLKEDGFEGGAVKIEDLSIFPALPSGIAERLTQSLDAARTAGHDEEALLGADRINRCEAPGLTYGDLRSLERLLCGDKPHRWDDGKNASDT